MGLSQVNVPYSNDRFPRTKSSVNVPYSNDRFSKQNSLVEVVAILPSSGLLASLINVTSLCLKRVHYNLKCTGDIQSVFFAYFEICKPV
jgi:hypothetical protein